MKKSKKVILTVVLGLVMAAFIVTPAFAISHNEFGSCGGYATASYGRVYPTTYAATETTFAYDGGHVLAAATTYDQYDVRCRTANSGYVFARDVSVQTASYAGTLYSYNYSSCDGAGTPWTVGYYINKP